MKTILVPTDFSDASRSASLYAAEFAKIMQCEVVLYHTYLVPIVIASDMPITIMMNPEILRQETLALLKKEADIVGEITGTKLLYEATEGDAVTEIIEIERTNKPDLIIMGMKESGPVSEYIIGSIATDVIRQSLTPVLIIPIQAKFKQFKKIVFATDYSLSTDTHLLEPIKEFCKIFYSKLFILNVVKELELIGVEKEVSRMRIQNYFEDLEHQHYYLEDDDIIHGLNNFIDEYGVDVIAMLPHRHNLFSRIFKEGSTKKMAFHTHIPLLTMPSRSF
ncbi:MAG: universal stress protein [Bacteroidetes bacterium]|nr:universal stress protein [Bacteroidota bacterium]